MEGAARQEVPFHIFDQVLDRALLVPRSRSAHVRVELELHRQLLVGRIPDRLMLLIAPQHGGLHIVGHHRPRHATNGCETGNQAAQQCLLAHILLETDEHEAAVLEPGSEKVARLSAHALFGEGHVSHLAPIDLQVLAWHPFKAQRQVMRGLLAHAAHLAHVIVEGRFSSLVGMLGICPRQLKHADHRDILVQPVRDLGIKYGDRAYPLTGLRLLVHVFSQHAGNRVAMVSGEFVIVR